LAVIDGPGRPGSRWRIESVKKRIHRWRRGAGLRAVADELAPEEPLEIRVETRPISVTMRTPGHDAELAAGFLLSEGLLRSADDLAAVKPYARNTAGNVVDVFLAAGVEVDFARLTRHVFGSSSCGLCGAASIEAVQREFPRARGRWAIRPETLLAMPEVMGCAQTGFARSGGVHAAALFAADGALLCLREDVGRHNAVDKVLGWALLDRRLPLDRHVLMVSGRASFEILQKALSAGIGFVAAVSAPSSLAVEFARRSGQTLVGFLREGRFNVYAGRPRIAPARVRRRSPRA
jgi:FdhD protein